MNHATADSGLILKLFLLLIWVGAAYNINQLCERNTSAMNMIIILETCHCLLVV